MYKVKNGLSPKPVRDLFTTQQSVYILRQSDFALPGFAAMTSGKVALDSLVFWWSPLLSLIKKNSLLAVLLMSVTWFVNILNMSSALDILVFLYLFSAFIRRLLASAISELYQGAWGLALTIFFLK